MQSKIGIQDPPAIQLSFDFSAELDRKHDGSGVPIDFAFPESLANEIARLEAFNKHLYRPNTYLHKWWARRSGTTFRHILKQLVADPTRRGFYEPGGLEGKVILDPMMGGGTTLHEAIRMGANVAGIDIDPIPVVQASATLQLQQLSHSRNIFSQFIDRLKVVLAPLFKTSCPVCDQEAETQFLLYGLRRRCSCREVLFVDSYTLRENHDLDVRLCPTCHSVYQDVAHQCLESAHLPILEKGTRRCPDCGSTFQDLIDLPFAERYRPLAVVGVCPQHSQFFRSPTASDYEQIEEARRQAAELRFGDAQDFRVPDGPKSGDLLRRGIESFLDLFSARQLLFLRTSLDLVAEFPSEDRLWLSLLISTSLEFNAMLCGYKGSSIRRPGAVRHVFSHHAYSFPYTALENNPIFSGSTSGTLMRLFEDRIIRASRWATKPLETIFFRDGRKQVPIGGEIDGGRQVYDWQSLTEGSRRFLVLQADSSSVTIPPGTVDFVVTDPPYYDNVQYSDLSTFFRVWLRHLLPDVADWNYDPLASAVSEGDALGNTKYGEVLGGIWQTCNSALKPDHGRLIFTFHHWKHEAWAELTLSLKRARFVLVNRYVAFSENPISVHIKGLKALEHDAILVLRPLLLDETPIPWSPPPCIDTDDSYRFCHDCGTALGHFLASNLDEKMIRAGWQAFFSGDNNAKAPS
jgi:putative DNA methylase